MTDLQLWPDQVGPATFLPAWEGSSVSTEFEVTTGTWWVKELRVWRGSWEMTGPLRAQLYLLGPGGVGSVVAGSRVVIPVRGLGWQVGTLPTPVQLVVGTTYRAVAWSPRGFNATLNYWRW